MIRRGDEVVEVMPPGRRMLHVMWKKAAKPKMKSGLKRAEHGLWEVAVSGASGISASSSSCPVPSAWAGSGTRKVAAHGMGATGIHSQPFSSWI